MNLVDLFEAFAADFEAAVQDDDWLRLAKYLAEDASYENVGGPDPQCRGRAAILDYLQNDVAENDRRFDTRTLVALTPPEVNGNRLRRRWRCTYTLAGAPDLVVEGEARYLFDGERIKAIEQQPTPESLRNYGEWLQQHAHRLHAAPRAT